MEEQLLRRAKAAAAEDGDSLTAFIEEAIRRRLEARAEHEIAARPDIPLFAGGGRIRPGVDLDDSAALVDLMEGR